MNEEQIKKLAYDLTIEYAKVNAREILLVRQEDIPNAVQSFSTAYHKFYDSIKADNELVKLLP